jgi:hypothetical protein
MIEVGRIARFIVIFGLITFSLWVLDQQLIGFSKDSTRDKAYDGRMWAFLMIHLPFMLVMKGWHEWLWYLLTILHGLAHVTHPALHGIVPNPNYNALYDYIVHGAQCLTIVVWSPKLLAIGVLASQLMITGAAITYVHKPFFETFLWILISGLGVFGTQYHSMLLLSKTKARDYSLFIAGWILWVSPYLGYLIPNYIPEWDAITNRIGLFRMWYLAFFLSVKWIQSDDCSRSNRNKLTEYCE